MFCIAEYCAIIECGISLVKFACFTTITTQTYCVAKVKIELQKSDISLYNLYLIWFHEILTRFNDALVLLL